MNLRGKDADGKTLSELRRAKRKRKKTRKKILLGIMLMLFIGIGVLFTPVFNLKEIAISGNKKVETKTVIEKSGFIIGENIFKFKLDKAGVAIASIPYINSVEILRKLPGKIQISVTECIPLAYIQAADGIIVVDKDGKVLEKKSEEINYKIPILYDFKFDNYTLGKKIFENNNEKLKKTLEITKNLYNNNIIEDVLSITTVKGDIYLHLDSGMKVIIGNEENIASKLTMLKEVLAKLPDGAGGIIDARDPSKLYHRAE